MKRKSLLSANLCFALLLGACSDGNSDRPDSNANNPFPDHASVNYQGTDNWLCRPDLAEPDNACHVDLSATLVFADGSTQFEPSPEVASKPINCFYLYPTVSGDTTFNSDFEVDIEVGVTSIQAARYRTACNVYAPVYRQLTRSAFAGGAAEIQAAYDFAYDDVLDAFKQFVADTNGQGYILIGHSQGSVHLIRLIQEEIETNPWLAERMVSSHMVGFSVDQPVGEEVGGSFTSTPPCSFSNNYNCFVSYASFLRSAPPPEMPTIYPNLGLSTRENHHAACTHPNQLGGGTLPLDSYFVNGRFSPYADPDSGEPIETPLIKVPGLIQGECIIDGRRGYLAIDVNADPSDPRTDVIGGESLPNWGLHAIDVDLVTGNLVELAQLQYESWERARE